MLNEVMAHVKGVAEWYIEKKYRFTDNFLLFVSFVRENRVGNTCLRSVK